MHLMIGERYAELLMPKLAVDHYKQAIAILHFREHEEGLPTVVVIDSQEKIADVFLGGGKEREERLFEAVGSLIEASAKRKESD